MILFYVRHESKHDCEGNYFPDRFHRLDRLLKLLQLPETVGYMTVPANENITAIRFNNDFSFEKYDYTIRCVKEIFKEDFLAYY